VTTVVIVIVGRAITEERLIKKRGNALMHKANTNMKNRG
jgi:hypothetical protein